VKLVFCLSQPQERNKLLIMMVLRKKRHFQVCYRKNSSYSVFIEILKIQLNDMLINYQLKSKQIKLTLLFQAKLAFQSEQTIFLFPVLNGISPLSCVVNEITRLKLFKKK
jgi:hypothetical protein